MVKVYVLLIIALCPTLNCSNFSGQRAWFRHNALPESYFSLPVPNILRCSRLCERQTKCIAVTFDVKQRMCYLHDAKMAAVRSSNKGIYMSANVPEEQPQSENACSDTQLRLPSAGKEGGTCVELDRVHLKSIVTHPTTQSTTNAQSTDGSRLTEPECVNGGTWNVSHQECRSCNHGFAGQYCERRIYHCGEGMQMGYTGKENVLIQPIESPEAFMVKCIFKWGLTVTLQRGFRFKCTGSFEQFNRTWAEYKNGFGNVDCEHFIGLDNLYLMTKHTDMRLRIQLWIDGVYKQAYYNNFVIGDERKEKFMLTYHSYTTNIQRDAGDGLGLGGPGASTRNSSFCTPDNDCGSCATESKSGWWFDKNCSNLNLNVPLNGDNTLYWPFTADNDTLVAVEAIQLALVPQPVF